MRTTVNSVDFGHQAFEQIVSGLVVELNKLQSPVAVIDI